MSNSVESTLGEVIREAREAQDIGLRQLAELIGVSPPFIHDVEKGRRGITDVTAKKLAKALGVEEDVILQKAWERKMREMFETSGVCCPRCNFPRDE